MPQLPPGTAARDLFTGDASWDDVTTIAQDNKGHELSLVPMRPGTYTLTDFIPTSDGRPTVLHGMEAQLTIASPEECRRPQGRSGPRRGW